MQLVEVEQQTPYLESFAGVTAGTATDVGHPPRVRSPGPRAGLRAVRQPQRRRQPRVVPARRRGRRHLRHHRGVRARARTSASCRSRSTAGRSARRSTATPPTLARAEPLSLGTRRALRGQAHADDDGDGQERGVDRLPRRPRPARARLHGRAGSRRRPRWRRPRSARTVPATLALTLGAPPTFGAVPARRREASTRRPRPPTSSRPRVTRR